jgi:uncharacterized protein YraI
VENGAISHHNSSEGTNGNPKDGNMKRIFMTLVSLLVATSTAAASSALVTTDLNLRASPDTRYRPITVLPAGAIVDLRGCVRSYAWCRVSWRGYDGWAYSRYLANREGSGYAGGYDNYAVSVGIPIIAGIVIGSAFANRYNYYGGYRPYRGYGHYRGYRPYRGYGSYYRPRYSGRQYNAPNSHEPGDLW